MRTPKVGDLVLYSLSEQNANQINRRRSDASLNVRKMREERPGFIAHIGNSVAAGDVFPMTITRVWGSTPGCAVNGQVMLDGNDLHWVTSVNEVDGVSDPQGRWRYRD